MNIHDQKTSWKKSTKNKKLQKTSAADMLPLFASSKNKHRPQKNSPPKLHQQKGSNSMDLAESRLALIAKLRASPHLPSWDGGMVGRW